MLLVSLKCNFLFDPPNHPIWHTLFPFTNRNTKAQRCKEFAQADISKKESSWNQAWVTLALEPLPATHQCPGPGCSSIAGIAGLHNSGDTIHRDD